MTHQNSDRDWLEWIEVQKRAARALAEADLVSAINEVEEYLRQEPGAELQGEALGFRALLREDGGALEEAKQDLLAAISLSQPASYQRYTLQLALGSVVEKLGEPDEAASYYSNALETVANDPSTSGGSAVLRLLQHRGDHGLKPEERALASRVIQQSWQFLRLEGEPDLEDLAQAAEALVKAQGQRLPGARAPEE